MPNNMRNPDPQFFYQTELFSDGGSCPYQITGKFNQGEATETYFFYSAPGTMKSG